MKVKKRSACALFLCIMLIFTAIAPAASASEIEGLSQESVVFVKSDGTNGDGLSSDTAKTTISAAVDALKSTGGTIVVCGPLRLDAYFVASLNAPNKITITSLYDGIDYASTSDAYIEVKGQNACFNGDFEFNNITIKYTSAGEQFWASYGNRLVMGENINCITTTDKYLGIVGGMPSGITVNGNPKIEIHSGIYSFVSGGGRGTGTTEAILIGNPTIKIYGGAFKGTTAEGGISVAGGGMFNNAVVNGSTQVEIRGGTFEKKVIAGGTNSSVSGTTNLIIYGGTFKDVVNGGGIKTSNTTNADVGGTSVLITDGIFTSYVSGGSYNGSVKGNVSLEIQGGTFNNHVMGAGTHYSNDSIVYGNVDTKISGGVFNLVVAGGSYYNASGQGYVGGKINTTILGGTFNNTFFGAGNCLLYDDVNIDIQGGTFNGDFYAGERGFDINASGKELYVKFTGSQFTLASPIKKTLLYSFKGTDVTERGVTTLDLSETVDLTQFSNSVLAAQGTPNSFNTIYQPVGEVQSITIKTPPTKLSYYSGDIMELDDLVISTEYNSSFNGRNTADIDYNQYIERSQASHFSVSPQPLATGIQEAVISYGQVNANQAVEVETIPDVLVLESISVKNFKNKYFEGAKIDTSSIVITAHYEDTTLTHDIPYDSEIFELSLTGALTKQDTSLTISYTKDGITKSVVTPISVHPMTVIYIKDGGAGDGMSPDSPLAAQTVIPYDPGKMDHYYKNSVLYQAFDKLKEKGGTIVVCGEVKLGIENSYGSGRGNRDFLLPNNGDNTITITSFYDGIDYRNVGARLVIETPAQLQMAGKTAWENIQITTNGEERIIACAGYQTVFGEGVTTATADSKAAIPQNAKYFISVVGGNRYISSSTLDNSNITVLSGTFNKLVGGIWGWSLSSPPESPYIFVGDTNIKLGGSAVVLGGIAGGSNHINAAHMGNVSIVISGGTVYGNIEGTNTNGFFNDGAIVRLKINDGDLSNITGFYGGYNGDTRYNQPYTAQIDFSSCEQAKFDSLASKYIVEEGVSPTKNFNKLFKPGDEGTTEDGKVQADKDTMRQSALTYMEDMAQIPWTAGHNIIMRSGVTYEAGMRYQGLPYESVQGGIDEFLFYYNTDSTIFAPPGSNIPGNDAATAILVSWLQIGNEVTAKSLNQMLPMSNCGVVPVGDYLVDKSKTSTQAIIEDNNAQVMYEAYTKLMPADAIVTTSANGHAGMVSAAATVVRNGVDSIDGENSFITTIEQTPTLQDIGGGVESTYTTKIYTFEELYNQGYLPVTCPELATGYIDEPHAMVVNTNPINNIIDSFKGTVYTNYDMSWIMLTIKNKGDDSIVYTRKHYPVRNLVGTPRSRALSAFGEAQSHAYELSGGEYEVSVTVKIRGQEIDVVDYQFTIAEQIDSDVIFISGNGTGNGSSADNALKAEIVYAYKESTVQRYYLNSVLYQAADMLKDKGGTIVICGEVRIGKENTYGSSAANRDFIMPINNTNKITITSVYDGIDYREVGAKLVVETPAQIQMNGKSEWKNLEICTNGTDRVISCSSHETIFGEGLVTTTVGDYIANAENASYFMSIAGGSRYTNSDRFDTSDITILSGSFNKVVGGMWGVNVASDEYVYAGNTNIRIGGSAVLLGGVLGGSNINSYHAGNVNITVDGGAIFGNIQGTNNRGFANDDANVRIKINDGDFSGCTGIYAGYPGMPQYSQPYQSTLDLSEAKEGIVEELEGKYTVSGNTYTPDFNRVALFGEDPGVPEMEMINEGSEAMRQKVYDHMYASSQIEWAPSETFDSIPGLTYVKGVTYKGMPYTYTAIGNLDVFQSNLEAGMYIGTTATREIRSNHCSNSVFQSWDQVGNSVTAVVTDHMSPSRGYGALPVGDYDYSMYKLSTLGVILANDPQTIFESYALLQLADGILYRGPTAGHARMVAAPPVVVRNTDGSINGAESYLTTIEQTSSWDQTVPYGTSWMVNHKYTFDQLLATTYIPVTTSELSTGVAEKPRFLISSPTPAVLDGGAAAVERLLAGTLYSTYNMPAVRVEITGRSKAEIYSKAEYPVTLRAQALSSFADAAGIVNSLPEGRYTFTLIAKVRGEETAVKSIPIVIGNPSPIYSVVYNGNRNTSGTAPVDIVDYDSGDSVEVLANTGNLAREGYIFAGWNTQEDGLGIDYAPGALLTIGESNMILYAKWQLQSSGSVAIPSEGQRITEMKSSDGKTVIIAVDAKTSSAAEDGKITATLSASTVTELFRRANENKNGNISTVVDINITPDAGTATTVLEIPGYALRQALNGNSASLRISTEGMASINFDEQALQNINSATDSGDLRLTVAHAGDDFFAGSLKQIEDRPAFRFSISVGDTEITDLANGSALISIPYKPRPEENHQAIVVYGIDQSGTASIILGRYDPQTGAVRFYTNYMSAFSVGYNEVNFHDVQQKAWYSDAVSFMAARNLVQGIGDGKFAPEANLRRADFLIMVMNAYGIKPNAPAQENFSDAGNTYYTQYLSTAKNLGLVNGIGDNKFLPEATISREDMFVVLYRILEMLGKLPEGTERDDVLNGFTDVDSISSYARDIIKYFVGIGVVNGDGENLNPGTKAIRAEAAQILYNQMIAE